MQPPASALGVLAVLSVVMTALTEAENVAIEEGIRHQKKDEYGNRTQEYKESANRTMQVVINRNSTVTSLNDLKIIAESYEEMINISTINNFINGESSSNVAASHGIEDLTDHDESIRNLQAADLRKDTSVKINISANHNTSSKDTSHDKSPENELKSMQVEIVPETAEVMRDLNKVDSGEDHLNVENSNHTEVPENSFTFDNVPDTDTENAQSIVEQTPPVENNKLNSFQIPSTEERAEIEDGNQSSSNPHPVAGTDVKIIEEIKKPSTKKPYLKNDQGPGNTSVDYSKTLKNQGPPKSTKAFYEIKSLVTTEADGIALQEMTTQRTVPKFNRATIPWMPSAVGKFGPYFEEGEDVKNVTARIGTTVLLDCKIGMLHDKTVTWLQHSKDSIQLLTVGRLAYSADQRVSLSFRYPSNWRLQILYASPRDSGLYECQVATHPPRVKKINLVVTAPVLTIVDEAGRIVAGERHLKAGSALKLSCEARDVRESEGESVIWTRGDETLTEDVSENRTTDTEIHVIVSTVLVEKASPRHAGNYSCAVPGRARTTVAVHVLNGELPAAVHDGSGVSRAVLNLWLIHLTVSYVFSR